MATEPKSRQRSYRAFFGYFAIACVSHAVARIALQSESLAVIVRLIGFAALVATPITFGASIGCLFRRPDIGAVFGVCAFVVWLYFLP
jgi:hypothetical protein